MPLGVRDILLVLRAKDQASRVIADVGRSFTHLDKKGVAAQQQAIRSGTAIAGVGVAMAAVGAAGTAFYANSTKKAIDYNQQAALTLTQIDGVAASLEDVKKIGRDVANEVPAAFKQMQPALYDIFSSTNSNLEQGRILLDAFSRAAVAGQTDVSKAGRSAISIMNAFGFKPEEINHILDIQFETVRKGVLTYDELASTIGRAIPSAVKAGQSIEGLSGLIAFLTRNGLSAAMSATSAARAFDLLSNPKFKDNMKQLGIEVYGVDGRIRPFKDVMADLRKLMDGVATPEQAKNIQNFLGSVVDPKALEKLEGLGIAVKETTGGADYKAQIDKNRKAAASLATQSAQLRQKLAATNTKEGRKEIQMQLAALSTQRAVLSEQNINLQAAGRNATETMRPVTAIMADLDKLLRDMDPEQQAEVLASITSGAGGNIQAMRAINLALSDQKGLLEELTQEVGNSKGAFVEGYDTMFKQPASQVQLLKNNIETLRTEIGDQFVPLVNRAVKTGIGWLKWWRNLDPDIKKALIIIGIATTAFLLLGGAIATVVGGLIVLKATLALLGLSLGALMLTFAMWALVILAVAGAIALLITHWDEFKLGLRIVVAYIVDKVLATLEWLTRAAATAFGWVPGLGPKLRQAARDMEKFRDDVNAAILGIKDPVIKPYIEVTPAMAEFFKNAPSILGADPGKNVVVGPPLVIPQAERERMMQAQYDANHRDAPIGPGLGSNVVLERAAAAAAAAKASKPIVSSNVVQPRAMGGPMAAFKSYWVGERGPELLKMGSRGGRMVSNWNSTKGKDWDFARSDWLASANRTSFRFNPNVRLDANQVDDRRDYIMDPTRGKAWGRPYGREYAATGGGNVWTGNLIASTNADPQEIAHDVVFGLRYG